MMKHVKYTEQKVKECIRFMAAIILRIIAID
jgi:hypothetical protein